MATDTTPLGSIENPIKFRGQDYKTLHTKCLKSGGLFCDPTFPAEEKSIGIPDRDPDPKKEIKWLRPKEISKNAVFVEDTIGTTDICQGQLGDCWLLASLSCLTMHPTLFVKVVPPDQSLSESYAGIFHFTVGVAKKVADSLPVRQGQLLFSRSNTSNEFWSALVEKAYAKLIGSYGSLKGGNISEGMEDFTGGIAYSKDVSSHTPQDLWRRLKGALSRGGLLSCFIHAGDSLEISKVTGDGLVKGHAYAIIDCDKVTKASEEILLLKLRNPWGFVEYCGPWSDRCKNWDDVNKAERDRIKLKIAEEGEFWISAEAFSSLFNTVELCNVNPDTLDEENTPASPATWVINEHEGSWAPGSTAGGSRKCNYTYYQNPQFKLVLKEQDQTEEEDEDEDDEDDDDDEDDVKMAPNEQKKVDKQTHKAKYCTVVVELLQKNRRQKDKLNFLNIGFHVYRLQTVCLNRNFFKQNRPVGRSGKYSAQRGVRRKLRLGPGNYIIIASTYRPNQPGEFFVRTFAKRGNTLGPTLNPVMVTPISSEDQMRIQKTFDEVAGPDDKLNNMITCTAPISLTVLYKRYIHQQ
uniref:Calpain catalytic domain-containing protein n=1 Tax=Monopterus albus TaxID=43700 RepID=A0A3Q3JEG6_MONAL